MRVTHGLRVGGGATARVAAGYAGTPNRRQWYCRCDSGSLRISMSGSVFEGRCCDPVLFRSENLIAG